MNAIRAALMVGLAGSLATLPACGSKQEQPQLVANVGKVTEIAGSVTVQRGGSVRPLASNDSVDADDTIVTGADGRVVIVLAHNNARWELGPNLSRKVRTSTAWSLPKSDGTAKHVEQDTASAGRPAEREAAGTTASVSADSRAEPPPADQAAPGGGPPPPTDKAAVGNTESKAKAGPKAGAKAATTSDSDTNDRRSFDDDLLTKGGGGTKTTESAKALPPPTNVAPNPIAIAGQVLRDNQTKIAACLDRDGESATVIVHVAANQAITVDVTGKDISAAEATCIKKLVLDLAKTNARFPKVVLDVSVDVTK